MIDLKKTKDYIKIIIMKQIFMSIFKMTCLLFELRLFISNNDESITIIKKRFIVQVCLQQNFEFRLMQVPIFIFSLDLTCCLSLSITKLCLFIWYTWKIWISSSSFNCWLLYKNQSWWNNIWWIRSFSLFSYLKWK
jgi:hypothetical protein